MSLPLSLFHREFDSIDSKTGVGGGGGGGGEEEKEMGVVLCQDSPFRIGRKMRKLPQIEMDPGEIINTSLEL